MFPGGFESPKYLEQERNYKLRTRESLAALTPEAFVSLEEPELVTIVQRSFSATDNLLHRFEHTAIHGCLQLAGPERTRALKALGALLWEDASTLEDRFSEWAAALDSLPKAGPKSPSSWPVATALPFLTRPEIHCILKPTNARAFTRRYGFELGYDAQPNFITYGRWLCFVEAMEARLTPLGARDRLDVQSFLWRIDPAKGAHLI